MDQASVDFWQKHSLRFLEMVFRVDKREVLRHPDGYGKSTRECGDSIEIFLCVRDEVIVSASFETNGCLYAVACANAAVHLAQGKKLSEALEVTAQSIVDYLETLPEAEKHCADLARRALYLALASMHETGRNPWKKFYRVQ
jgi:nitrogen fixation protein NifU and related proteins